MISASLGSLLATAAIPERGNAQSRAAAPSWAPSPSGADSERKAAARALFEDGLVHADARRWSEAADRFERARALLRTPEITYNLSTAFVGMGKLVRASETLREITGDAQAPARVKAAAETRLAEVIPRLSHLTIHVPPRLVAGGASVRLDGQPVDAARLDVALPADPTSHRVEVHQGSSVVDAKDFVLREGERRTVSFPDADLTAAVPAAPSPGVTTAGVPAPIAAAAAPGVQATMVRDSGTTPKKRWWLWGALGVAVVGVSAAIIATSAGSDPAPNGNVGNWRLGPQ